MDHISSPSWCLVWTTLFHVCILLDMCIMESAYRSNKVVAVCTFNSFPTQASANLTKIWLHISRFNKLKGASKYRHALIFTVKLPLAVMLCYAMLCYAAMLPQYSTRHLGRQRKNINVVCLTELWIPGPTKAPPEIQRIPVGYGNELRGPCSNSARRRGTTPQTKAEPDRFSASATAKIPSASESESFRPRFPQQRRNVGPAEAGLWSRSSLEVDLTCGCLSVSQIGCVVCPLKFDSGSRRIIYMPAICKEYCRLFYYLFIIYVKHRVPSTVWNKGIFFFWFWLCTASRCSIASLIYVQVSLRYQILGFWLPLES